MSKQELIDTLLALPIDEKIEIVQILNASLQPMDKEIEKAWIDESLKRFEAYCNGQIETVTWRKTT